jgi:hypothetical protein
MRGAVDRLRRRGGRTDPVRAKVLQLGGLLLLGGAISLATVAAVVIATNKLKTNGTFEPEVGLPILLVAGLIALVAALAILVGTFSIFGLSSKTSAFGVPEGTLQAVIAMMIIMIFAITSLYLNASLKETTYTSTNISRAQLSAIPSDQIRSIKAHTNKSGVAVFDVERAVPSTVSEDFAKQLLTTLSTLVVAIIGFYFGAKSVESGVAAANSGPTNSSPPLILGDPSVGATLSADPGAWAGSPQPTYAYRWQRGDVSSGAWSDIPDATEKTYIPAAGDVGKSLRIAVTATNSVGSATVTSLPTAIVAAEQQAEAVSSQ